MTGKRKGERKIYLTASELAARTGLSVRYFQKLAKRVDFSTQPESGGQILFDESGFDAWLAAGRPKTTIGRRWRPPPPPKIEPISDDGKSLVRRLRAMRKALKA